MKDNILFTDQIHTIHTVNCDVGKSCNNLSVYFHNITLTT